MDKVTIIKFGGSIITDKATEKSPNHDSMKMLVSQLKRHMEETGERVIVVSGGGSYPHPVAKKYHLKEGIARAKKFDIQAKDALFGLASCALAASTINHILWEEFIKARVPAMSFRPSSIFTAKGGRAKSLHTEPLKRLLELGIVPLLYGDVIYDSEQGNAIASGEFIIKELCREIPTRKVIMCANVDGLFTKNPQNYPSEARFIDTYSLEVEKEIAFEGAAGVKDATGGMGLKVKTLAELSTMGIPSVLCNGGVPGNLYKALRDEKVGTVFQVRKG